MNISNINFLQIKIQDTLKRKTLIIELSNQLTTIKLLIIFSFVY